MFLLCCVWRLVFQKETVNKGGEKQKENDDECIDLTGLE